jgi:hypothetical protein
MSVMSEAAKAFGSPSITLCQLTVDRHPKTPHSNMAVTIPATRAKPKPLARSNPQTTDKPPKTEPEIRAVFAAAGFEINPASPQRKRKTPYPISNLEFVMALFKRVTVSVQIIHEESFAKNLPQFASDHRLVGGIEIAEFVMAAVADDAAFFEDEDAVGDADGAETVGNDEGGAAFD